MTRLHEEAFYSQVDGGLREQHGDTLIPCQVRTTYRGTRTGGPGSPNVEWGAAWVTTADGQIFRGEYTPTKARAG